MVGASVVVVVVGASEVVDDGVPVSDAVGDGGLVDAVDDGGLVDGP